jgi:hypothetical protein
MKETIIAGDWKPTPEDPKPNPKPPSSFEEYLVLLIDYYANIWGDHT